MNTRAVLLVLAAVLAVAVVALGAWIMLGGSGTGAGSGKPGRAQLLSATNPALDVRYEYDAGVFSPADYDAKAEYPLHLRGDGFDFHGKRIRGVGRMLAQDPGGMLYDFVGVEHMESLEQYYKLRLVGDPVYEDAQIAGRLGLHQQYRFEATADSRWPQYFPPEYQLKNPPDTAYVEGWAVFTSEDLFFFQAVSVDPLTPEQRKACMDVMDSMQFGAVLGGSQPPLE